MSAHKRIPLRINGDVAVKILEAFHLQNKAVSRFVFTMDVETGASIEIWYWPEESEIDADSLKTTFKEYELVERGKIE